MDVDGSVILARVRRMGKITAVVMVPLVAQGRFITLDCEIEQIVESRTQFHYHQGATGWSFC